MSTAYSQQQRPLVVNTPLGEDVLLLTGFSGSEGLSQLFRYTLNLVAPNDKVDQVTFDKLLGQSITVTMALADGSPRYFNGICSQLSQGESGAEFTEFQMEIVPVFWLWTQRAQSRIFQHVNVPDILKQVLQGLDVKFQLEGNYEKRDFCVQYRETDFNFACRLLEEEGMYYYFKPADGEHPMVVSDNPSGHVDLPTGSTIIFRDLPSKVLEEDVIYDWTKSQGITSGKYTLWDYRFEMPRKHLDAEAKIQPSVQIGGVSHTLQVGNNGELEIYDWPGEYAQRFDGVDKGGGDQKAELEKVFEDNLRTTKLRMEEEAVSGIRIQGASNCRQMLSGHTFTLKTMAADTMTKHLKADGKYLLTSVYHSATNASFRSGGAEETEYSNSFACLPADIPFRPQRTTPKPVVAGTQTALVVGPPGEEIFTDRFGRVKVQFHWDRQGQYNADSSCWIRVAQVWSGKRWGASFWPRIGQEVIVDFLEGDPAQPIIVGSVYNEEQMPPYLGDGLDSKHKNDNKVSGIKTNTTPGGEGFNEIRFDDTKDKQQIFIHAERNTDTRVKKDCMETIGGSRHLSVGGDQNEQIGGNKNLTVKKDHVEKIEGNMELLIGGEGGNQDIVIKKDKKELIEGNNHVHVMKDRNEAVDGDQSLTIGGNQYEFVEKNHGLEASKEIYIKAGQKLILEATQEITIVQGANFIKLDASGVTIFGAPMTLVNSGGAAGMGTAFQPKEAEDAKEAEPAGPAAADESKSGSKSAPEE